MENNKILFVLGTRPEALKLAPLILKLKFNQTLKYKICLTNQHDLILNDVIKSFNLVVDFNLNLLKKSPDLNSLLSNGIKQLSEILGSYNPNLVIVQGDTISSLIGGLSAYYRKIKVAHVEAGLRSFDLNQPWPEELNRRILSMISNYHFTPTLLSKKNLIDEKINKKNIYVTGNTIIDTLKFVKKKLHSKISKDYKFDEKFKFKDKNQIRILFTCHRRENLNKNINLYIDLLIYIEKKYDACVIVINHPNPNSRFIVNKRIPQKNNFKIYNPLNFVEMTYLYDKVDFILSDSGGIQEEAPSFHKKVLVLRNKTERPEGLKTGHLFLMGDNLKKMKKFIDDFILKKIYKKRPLLKNPYGDGKAADRIVRVLEKELL